MRMFARVIPLQRAAFHSKRATWFALRSPSATLALAAPPPAGQLRAEIEKLAAREWRHPITGAPIRFSFSSMEHWYYQSLIFRQRNDPVGALRRKVRTNADRQIAMNDAVRQALLAQYAAHRSWSITLHRGNLAALARDADLRPIPSYATIRRFFKANGLEKRRRLTSRPWVGYVERSLRSMPAHIKDIAAPGQCLDEHGWLERAARRDEGSWREIIRRRA